MPLDEKTTIAVTGANGLVGRALLKRLQQTSAHVIALTRNAVELPANRTVTGPLNSPSALAALGGATYVAHLAGILFPIGKDSYRSSNVEATETVARALKNGKTRRVLFLSHVGASEGSKNIYLRTKAAAERLLIETEKEVVVFRCTHIIGPPEAPGPFALSLLKKQRKKAGVIGSGRQIVAPIFVGDVVSALVSAMKGGSPGIYELAGPEQMPMDDLVRLLNRNPAVPISHLPNWAARMMSFLPILPFPFVDMILHDSVGNPAQATATFSLRLTSLRTVW